MEKRSRYYQTIAMFFFEQRGAPFFLSSKEFDTVSGWEKMNIPLRVVLEGIKASFEGRKHKTNRRRHPYTLDHSHAAVIKAYAQHKERQVGRKAADFKAQKESRDKKIRVEVERFLKDIPESLNDLQPVYARILKRLTVRTITEEELEEAEDVIEEIIVRNAPPGQKRIIGAEITQEFGVRRGKKFDQIFRMKVVKSMREKFKIPHVSPFYY